MGNFIDAITARFYAGDTVSYTNPSEQGDQESTEPAELGRSYREEQPGGKEQDSQVYKSITSGIFMNVQDPQSLHRKGKTLSMFLRMGKAPAPLPLRGSP